MNNIDLEKLQIKRKISRLKLRLKYLEELEAIEEKDISVNGKTDSYDKYDL